MLAPHRVLGLHAGRSVLRRAPGEEAASTLSRIHPLTLRADGLQASLVCWGRRRALHCSAPAGSGQNHPLLWVLVPTPHGLKDSPVSSATTMPCISLGIWGFSVFPQALHELKQLLQPVLGGQSRAGVGVCRRSGSVAPAPPGPTALPLCPQPAQFQQQTGPAHPGADPGAPGQPPPQPDQHQTEL